MNKIEIIIPVYNEGESLAHSIDVINNCLGEISGVQFSLLIIDDGSQDDTCEKVLALPPSNIPIKLISFTRNFGKEAALRAGLDNINDDTQAIIIMDCDLQHPPETIKNMIEHWRSGYVVVEAVKSRRNDNNIARTIISNSFYSMFRYFTHLDLKNHSDFKLLDREVVENLVNLKEQKLFFRGITKWMGFRTAQIEFLVAKRHHGRTKWSLWRLFLYSVNSVTSFSSGPLQLVTLAGALLFLISLLFGGIAIYDKITGDAIGGFTTVILLLLSISSILMFSLGLIGIYISKIYDEIKSRPNYIIDEKKSRADHFNRD